MRLAGLLAVFIACVHADLVCLQGGFGTLPTRLTNHYNHDVDLEVSLIVFQL